MRDHLYPILRNFLRFHHQGGPLLLGFSGGCDSMALLHLLVAYQKKNKLTFHVAHVDHGWREESGQEAEDLHTYCKKLELPFHSHRLESLSPKNLEDQSRKLRLQFFSKIYQSLHCEALLLAHHADDQAETVLKRIFEGAHLMALGGLKEHSYLEGMQIWRPLLAVKKQTLENWLTLRKLSCLEDKTNHEERFLRARMRTTLLPLLSKHFGKQISSNLCYLAETCQKLSREVEGKVAFFLSEVVSTEKGFEVPKSCLDALTDLEKEMGIKLLCQKQGLFISRDQLKQLVSLFKAGCKKMTHHQGEWSSDSEKVVFKEER